MRIVSTLQGGLEHCQHIFHFFFLPEIFIKVISSVYKLSFPQAAQTQTSSRRLLNHDLVMLLAINSSAVHMLGPLKCLKLCNYKSFHQNKGCEA